MSALRGSGPPTHPRIFFLWGLRPHAPTRTSRGRNVLPRPAPSPLAGEGGGEGERAQPARCPRGAAPPTPPSRTSALRGSGPPTRPRIFFLWGPRPHAPTRSAGLRRRRIGSRPQLPRPVQPPRPLRERVGVRGSGRSPPRGKAPAGEPRSPPGTTPRLPTQPQDPEWIVEGGCGGEPPLETTANTASRPRVDRRGGVWGLRGFLASGRSRPPLEKTAGGGEGEPLRGRVSRGRWRYRRWRRWRRRCRRPGSRALGTSQP